MVKSIYHPKTSLKIALWCLDSIDEVWAPPKRIMQVGFFRCRWSKAFNLPHAMLHSVK